MTSIQLATKLLGCACWSRRRPCVAAQQPAPPPPPPQQPTSVELRAHRRARHAAAPGGARPARAVDRSRNPGRGADHRRGAVGRPDFEREFYMIPRDTYKSIPAAGVDRRGALRSLARAGRRRRGDRHRAEDARPAFASSCGCTTCAPAQSVYGREYTGSAANPRLYAHTMADELHESQRRLRGVARTKLTFSPIATAKPVVGTVEKRDVKEVYVADYDGANQRRITINRDAEHHAELVARRPLDRLHLVSHGRAGHPDLEHLRRHDGDRRPRASARTGCRCSRPTARASRSRRTATATPRST